MDRLSELCGALGVYVSSLKKLVQRIAEAYSEGRLEKSSRRDRHSKSIRSLQEILGYKNYSTLWKHVLVLTLSGVDLGKFDSRLSGLKMKVLGVGFGHCELTAIQDETLELQDNLMKVLEHLPRLRIALFPKKPLLRGRENWPLYRRLLERAVRRRRFLSGELHDSHN